MLQLNLDALIRLSPDTARRLAAADAADLRILSARSGDSVIERQGRLLDSGRDPRAEAERQARSLSADTVVVAGFGGGYLAQALLERGIGVTAIVEPSAATLRAALGARDLRPVLERVPIVLLDSLSDALALARLRAGADTIVAHGPTVAASPDLRALVDRWSAIAVATRRPRALVVGPIYGGSLEIARATAGAAYACGADVEFFEADTWAGAYHMVDALQIPAATRRGFQAQLAELLSDTVVALAAAWRPDVVVALAQAPLGPSALARLRTCGIATAFWFVENHRVLPYWKDLAPHYDWFYAIQPGAFLEKLHRAGAARPRYLPVGCDPERHTPVTLNEEERRHWGADVSFAGAPYLNRRRVFSALTDFDLRLWGAGWGQGALAAHAADGGRAFSLPDMVRIFAASKVNLNLHSAEHHPGLDPDADYVNPRTFELASCGAFQLVDERAPLSPLFSPDEVATFSSVQELRAAITHYLSDETARADRARRARARARAEHTYRHRVAAMFADVLRPDLLAAASRDRTSDTLNAAIAREEAAGAVLGRREAALRVVRELQRMWGVAS